MSEIQIYDKYVTSSILVKNDWFYHSFSSCNLEKYLKRGILPKIFGVKNQYSYNINSYVGYNGLFHVSLSRKVPGILWSSYSKYIDNNWAFIVSSNIDFIKTENIFTEGRKIPRIELTNIFWNSIYGLRGKRYSTYDDEYHKFGRISPKDIIGIKIGKEVRYLNEVLEMLEQKNIDLPLIDIDLGISIKGK